MNLPAFLTARPPTVSAQALRASFHMLAHDAADGGFVPHPDVAEIILDKGKLIVGNVPVHTARFSADTVRWVQRTAGHYTAGHLYFHDGGLSVHGTVSTGATAAAAVPRAMAGTAVTPVAYTTRITRDRFDPATDPSTIHAGEWEDGLALVIGYTLAIGETIPAPTVALDGNDITADVAWTLDAAGNTVLEIGLDDSTCQFFSDGYRTARLAFDPYVPVPTGKGSVTRACSDPSAVPAGVRLWAATSSPAAELARTRSVAQIAAADLHADDDPSLSITELITIVPDETVTTASQDMLMRNMKWAMGQDSTMNGWLNTFLGLEAPVITETDQLATARLSLAWYQNQLGIAYLTKAFQEYSGPNQPTDHRLSADQETKLNNWFKSGLAASADFTIQQKGVFIDAFRATDPRLDAYLADGAKWTETLYQTLTAPSQLVIMINRVAGVAADHEAMVPLNNFACLLTALSPDAKKATDYFNTVLTGVVNHVVPNSTHLDRDTILQWLPKALETLLQSLATNGIPGGDEVHISQQEAEEAYQEYLKHGADISAALADLISSINATGLIAQAKQVEDGFDTIVSRWPKLAKVSKLMFAVLWIGSVASVIMTLVKGDWSKMSDIERAQFVTQIATTVMQGFEAVPLIYNGAKSMTLAIWNKFSSKVTEADQLDAVGGVADGISDGGSFVRSAATSVDVLMAGGEAAPGAFARIFAEGIASGVVKIFGAVAAAAMAAYSLWQLIEDVKNHGSVTTEVFDSLIFAANLLSAACLTVALFVSSAAIPIAGAVLALVGVILSIVESYEEKPDNPVDDWMRDHGIPFVDGIARPPTPTPALAPAPTPAPAPAPTPAPAPVMAAAIPAV